MGEKYEGKIESREYIPDQESNGMGIGGTWINKRTGKTVNVRNSIMDDSDNMIIITDKGQITMNEFTRYYIQASDEIYDETGKVIGHEEVRPEDYGQNADWEQIQEALNNQNKVVEQQTHTNDNIIKKVFDKLSSYPQIDVDIKWDVFPEAQIRTLVDYLDISINDISKYIITNYVNIDAIAVEITKILKSKLDKNIEEVTNE